MAPERRWDTTDAIVEGFEQSPEQLIVVQGEQLRVVAVNRAFLALTPGQDPRGVPLREAFPQLEGQQVLERYDECFRTGETQVEKQWRLVFDPGGDQAPLTVYMDFRLAPWRDEQGEIVGVLGMGSDVTESVERRLRAEGAQRAAEQRHRDVLEQITDMQEVLLPDSLPATPALDLAATYLLATEHTSAGGDWFDAVPLWDESIALVVGDVVGHGVTASATMGQLRAVLRQRLLAGAGIADALGDLDLFASRLDDARVATVCVVRVSADGTELEYCTAGHPPPLVVSADGDARYLEPTGSGPLATGADFAVVTLPFGADDMVVLYSDGLTERPGRTPTENTVELLTVVGDAVRYPSPAGHGPSRLAEHVCRQTLELLTRISGYADDITILAARRTPAARPLDLTLPAVPASVGTVREAVRGWLSPLGLQDLDELRVLHSVGELVANVVEHAYPASDRTGAVVGAVVGATVGVVARIDASGTLHVVVSDTGRWRPPTWSGDRSRSRGLAVVRAMTDRLSIDRAAHGTEVTFLCDLHRPARLLRGSEWAHGSLDRAPAPADEFRLHEADDGSTLYVHGAVDLVSAGELETTLNRITLGGTRPVRIDLSDVSLLASSGVQVLHTPGPYDACEIYAPLGAPAQHVLDLVDRAYTTGPA